MIYTRLKSESIKDYKIRLCENKDLYNITFSKIAELINSETGENKSEGYFRRWWNGYKEGYQDGVNKSNDGILIQEIELKKIELEKEKNKFLDYRRAYNKDIRDDSRKEILKDIICQEISKISPYTREHITGSSGDNDLLVSLSDIHFGANINNYWNKYDSNIAKNRLDMYLYNILKIKDLHGAENCYVCANGDFISGNIHPTVQISNKENIVQQVMGVSELVSWFLSELSSKFKKIIFSYVPGNHSRLSIKENSPKDERLDLLIPWYIKARIQNIDNISVLDNYFDSTFNIINIRGLNYLNVHGDLDNPQGIQKIVSMIDIPVYCIHFGHIHHNRTDYFQKYRIITSGSLQGMDDYCIEKRIFGPPQQLVCVCNEDGILCHYDINFD